MLTGTTDYLGNKTTMLYDDWGNMISSIDAEDNETKYEYDLLGRMTRETNGEEKSIYYTFNSNGKVATQKDMKGNVTTNEYDVDDNLLKTIHPDGNEIKYTYNKNGELVKTTYQDGSSREVICDGTGNVIEEVSTDGTKITYEYDNLDRVIKETSESGNTVSYVYDVSDNIIKETYVDGSYMEYTYDLSNRKTSATDNKGHKTTYEYNKDGNLSKVTDALGKTIEYLYDEYGNQIEVKDKKGNVTKYEYDLNGNCTKVTDALGHETVYVYDKLNRNVEIKTTKGEETITTKVVYDTLGRVSKTIDELGFETTMTYDDNGNLLTVTDALGNVTTVNEYDEMDQLTKSTDALGNITSYTYNNLGQLIKQVENLNTDAETKYSFEYDKAGRITKTVDPLEGTSMCEYDTDGNLIKQIDPNGGETIYTYDKMGRVTSELNAIGSKNTYTYNALGLLEESFNARNQKSKYTYDVLGRIKIVEDEAGTITYTYDDNDNIEEIIEKTADGKTYKTTRTYDELNRVTSCTDYKGNTVKYSYDELGNLISLTYPGGEIVRYEYYANGNLKKVIDSSNRETLYEYDAVGNLIKKTRPNGTTEERKYDEKYQLIEQIEKDKEGNELSHLKYTYDDKGNIIKTEGYKETEEGIDKLTSSAMKYDKANRLIEYDGEEVKYDEDGNMVYGPVDGKMTELEYDCRNRLIKAGDITYEYDSENNRIATNTREYREEYVNNASASLVQVLEINRYKTEDDINDNGTKAYETTVCYYGNGLEYEITNDEVKYHHYNNVGSTLCITDEKGEITYEYSYGPYGELLSGDTIVTKFLYNGMYGIQTDINNLYYMRSRYYNPEVKRFINQDTLKGSIQNSQSLNRYSYVQGNPITLSDPFGTKPFLDTLKSGWNAVKSAPKRAVNFAKEHPHGTLDALGLVIPIAPDAANAIMYANEGNKKEAIISTVCAIPFAELLGEFAKGVKYLKTLRRTTKLAKTGKAVTKGTKGASKLFKVIRKTGSKSDDLIKGIRAGVGKIKVVASGAKRYADDVARAISYGIYKGGDTVVATFKAARKKMASAIKSKAGKLGDTIDTADDLRKGGDKLIDGVKASKSGSPSVAKPNQGQGFSSKGYNPQPGERTFVGYVKQTSDPEISLYTKSSGFNNNPKGTGGQFKRFGANEHYGLAPHVHQPVRNVTPNGMIFGKTGKDVGIDVFSPNKKDIKQLYEYLNYGKYHE